MKGKKMDKILSVALWILAMMAIVAFAWFLYSPPEWTAARAAVSDSSLEGHVIPNPLDCKRIIQVDYDERTGNFRLWYEGTDGHFHSRRYENKGDNHYYDSYTKHSGRSDSEPAP